MPSHPPRSDRTDEVPEDEALGGDPLPDSDTADAAADDTADGTAARPHDDDSERSPHDELFKATLGSPEHAASVLRSALPEQVSKAIDWSTLSVEPSEHLGRRLDRRYSDVLCRAQLASSKRTVYIEVLFEHQSRADPLMVLRMLGMIVRRTEALARRQKKPERLPIVLPVVLYQGDEGKGWQAPTRLSEILDADDETLQVFRPFIPDFRFALDDLSPQTPDDLYNRALTDIALVALRLLREARSNPRLLDAMQNPRDIETWRRIATLPNGAMVYQAFWIYIYRTLDVPAEAIHNFAHQLGRAAEETEMTAAQRLIEKMAPSLKAEGRAEGRVEGRAEGARHMLQRLIARKFGAIPAEEQARIEQASLEQLEQWTDRLLVASSIDELLS